MASELTERGALEPRAVEILTDRLLHELSYEELGEKYHCAPSTIHRWVHKWLAEKGRFELVDRRDGRMPAWVVGVDERLERALVTKTGIWRARVAHVSGAEAANADHYLGDPRAEAARAAHRAGDELHRALGEVAAEVLVNRLQRKSTVGVASGRGVAYSIDALAEQANRTALHGYDDVQVASLCGGVRVGSWASPDLRDLDADENALVLAAVLGVGRDAVTLMGPVTVDHDEAPSSGWSRVLNLALVGLGELSSGHHLLRERRHLGALAEPLARIARWQAREPRLVVAEIGHRLFPIRERGDLPTEFLAAIDQANRVVRAVPADALRQAHEVILVAAGAQKLNALVHLVTGRLPEAPIDRRNLILVTDAWTAESILARV